MNIKTRFIHYLSDRDSVTAWQDYLPVGAFVFFMFCCILQPYGAIRTGMLGDTDDYMRLNETINWLQGQGWHDLSHPRLSPGSHTVVHWSRLLDLPLALIMLPVIPLMGMQNAALLASFIVPPATFALLLWVAVRLARPFVGADRANFAAILTLFAPLTMMNFVPGRVDHHGYEVLIAGFALVCFEHMVEDDRRGTWYAVFAAVALACGLWIGTEALPWVLLFIGCLAVTAACLDGQLLRRAFVFSAAFTLATLIVLPLAVPFSEITTLALSWYSLTDVLLAALGMAVFGGLGLTCRFVRNVPARLGVLVLLALAAAVVVFVLMPQAANGPFADYDDFDSTIALANIGEAQPLWPSLKIHLDNPLQTETALLNFAQLMVVPLAALAGLVLALPLASQRRRYVLLTQGGFLIASLLLALFWQMRVGWFMQFFAVAPLTSLLVFIWKKIGETYAGRPRVAMEALAFVALTFTSTVLVPAIAHDEPFASHVLMFPAVRDAATCPLRAASDFLSEPWGKGDKQHTIISGANEGPELLFRTPHNVIAANFNVDGNRDVYDFFGARDDHASQAVARKWHADLVLVCRSIPPAYARLDHAKFGKTAFLGVGPNGTLKLVSSLLHPTLIERLVSGTAPAWLKPVEIPQDKDYLLFEIK